MVLNFDLIFCSALQKVSGVSPAAGQKNGQSNRIKNLTKYNFIFLTGSTGWTGYSYNKTK